MNLSKVIHAYKYLAPEDVSSELRDVNHSLSVNEQLHFASLMVHMILIGLSIVQAFLWFTFDDFSAIALVYTGLFIILNYIFLKKSVSKPKELILNFLKTSYPYLSVAYKHCIINEHTFKKYLANEISLERYCKLANVASAHQNFHTLISSIVIKRGFVSEFDYLQLNVDGLYKQLLTDQKNYVHDQGKLDIKGIFLRENSYV